VVVKVNDAGIGSGLKRMMVWFGWRIGTAACVMLGHRGLKVRAGGTDGWRVEWGGGLQLQFLLLHRTRSSKLLTFLSRVVDEDDPEVVHVVCVVS